MRRVEASFDSDGTRCAATLHLPDGVASPPVVVMAHGLAAERRFALERFAERFVAAGMAAFVFDYRSFGDSDGEPRNLVSPRRHVADFRAALAHVRARPDVDGDRVALWGTSLGGGHVLTLAARTPGLCAVVAQVPFVDGLASMARLRIGDQLRGLFRGLLDLAAILVGAAPRLVPVIASPDRFALMNTPDSEPGYRAMIPAGARFANAVPARALLTLPGYRPITRVRRIEAPVLLVAAEHDALIPVAAVVRAAARMREATLVRLPVGHFDVYRGAPFEEAVTVETAFLARAFGLAESSHTNSFVNRSRQA